VTSRIKQLEFPAAYNGDAVGLAIWKHIPFRNPEAPLFVILRPVESRKRCAVPARNGLSMLPDFQVEGRSESDETESQLESWGEEFSVGYFGDSDSGIGADT
jgi:hypothetical protein